MTDPHWHRIVRNIHRPEKDPPPWPSDLPCGHTERPHPSCKICAEHIALTEGGDDGEALINRA